MDTLSHAAWTWIIYRRAGAKASAVWFGIMPDIVSFLPHLAVEHFAGGQSLFDAVYRVTHSLIVFGVAAFTVGVIQGRMPWVLSAWGLHILIDIFTHPDSFYATPYLYPFHSPYPGAVDYREPWFMAANWVTILVVLVATRLRRPALHRSD